MSPCVNDSSTHVHCSKLIQFTLPRDTRGKSSRDQCRKGTPFPENSYWNTHAAPSNAYKWRAGNRREAELGSVMLLHSLFKYIPESLLRWGRGGGGVQVMANKHRYPLILGNGGTRLLFHHDFQHDMMHLKCIYRATSSMMISRKCQRLRKFPCSFLLDKSCLLCLKE